VRTKTLVGFPSPLSSTEFPFLLSFFATSSKDMSTEDSPDTFPVPLSALLPDSPLLHTSPYQSVFMNGFFSWSLRTSPTLPRWISSACQQSTAITFSQLIRFLTLSCLLIWLDGAVPYLFEGTDQRHPVLPYPPALPLTAPSTIAVFDFGKGCPVSASRPRLSSPYIFHFFPHRRWEASSGCRL